ncbi:hypothetical protein CAMSH0001_0379 [Campylobacter showae RM3277]|uniref:Uncharacterized protein n=1 Tax=Campylobacter showae RM3277 TaxID=553219 RepID=C6RF74_9BACT|nr:hypothetical protein CAMSH0001_0379 [Campylobacter showae RM3277]
MPGKIAAYFSTFYIAKAPIWVKFNSLLFLFTNLMKRLFSSNFTTSSFIYSQISL